MMKFKSLEAAQEYLVKLEQDKKRLLDDINELKHLITDTCYIYVRYHESSKREYLFEYYVNENSKIGDTVYIPLVENPTGLHDYKKAVITRIIYKEPLFMDPDNQIKKAESYHCIRQNYLTIVPF